MSDVLNPFDDQPEDVTPKEDVKKKGKTTLTEEQKKFINENYDKLDSLDITRSIFNNPDLSGRSSEGEAVRLYMRTNNLPYKTKIHVKKPDIELTEEQKEFILEYAKDLKPYEVARVIFKNEQLHQFSKESLTIQEYIKSVNPALLRRDDEFTDQEYSPPRTFTKTWKRICEVTAQFVEENKLNKRTRICVEKTMEFLQTPRFIQTTNNYKNISERLIFESEYIRAVWDKPDLGADEINMYISLVNEYIIQDRIQRMIGKLNALLEGVTQDADGKISISLSDAIKGKSEELHRSLQRQQSYVTDLSGKRSKRMEQQTAKAKSLVALVDAFKEEDERKAAVLHAERRKQLVKNEMERLETFEEWECRIFGITKEEILE